jgi:HTH-type transcriptional regulator / antitoxin HipB
MNIDVLHQELAQSILHHRKMAGLSQLELAVLAGVGKTVIFDLEHEKPSVRLDTVLKVLQALNIQIHIRSPLSA